jgi:uncharacterized BrkB/YihY/UPF0761 family membrane protein
MGARRFSALKGMLNLKSFLLLMAVFALLITAFGLVAFGVQLWAHAFGTDAGQAASSKSGINYAPLGFATSGVFMFVLFTVLYRWKK